MRTKARKLEILEKCEKIGHLLIPGDTSLGLIGVSLLIKDRFINDSKFQNLAIVFIHEIEEFLGYKIGDKDVKVLQIDDYLNGTKGDSRSFLLEILEMYYSDYRVLQYYPNFSGSIFPNHRQLPTLKIEMLEHVVSELNDAEN
jgi:hypothetical protein